PTVAEDDRHLDHLEAGADRAVGHLDLEGVAAGLNRIEVDRLQHLAAEALEAAGHVGDVDAEDQLRVGAAAAADRLAQRPPVADAAAGHVARAEHDVGLPRRRQQPRQVGGIVGEVRVHLQDQPGTLGQGAAEAGDVGGPEPFLDLAMQDADVAVALGEALGDRAGPVRGAVVDDQHPGRGRKLRPRGFDQGLDVLGLVIGGEDQPGGSGVGGRHRRRCYSAAERATKDGRPRVDNLKPMTNAEIAAALEELGVLYELDGAVRYRVLAYGTAANAIRESPVSVAELAAKGKATDVPGVGKTLAEKIDALLGTGEIPAAVKLKAKFPPTLIEVTRVPGLGAKTAKLLFDELGIASMEDLKKAAEGERIREVKGLGPKAEENVLASLERLGEPGEGPGRLLLSKVLPIAEELATALREHPAANRVELAGSARRWAETCKDIDIIATAEEPTALAEALVANPLIAAAGTPGPNGVRAQTHNGVSVDLRIVAPAAFGNLLQHFTGSKAHNVQLREEAVGRGLSVSEHGITDTESGKVDLCVSEAKVYERLGYAYIEPELREGRGELKAAREGKLPDLIEVGDIKGDLHSHTTLSDGRNTLAEMAEAGRERGYAYMAITDHSASHGFGDHVTPDRLWERIEEVRAWNKGKKGFRLLAGSEINIGLDGSLDYPDDLVE